MDFKDFYNNISDVEKLRYLEKLLESNSDLQKEFKDSVSIKPVELVADEPTANIAFAGIVANYSQKFKEDFSEVDFSEVDWDEIYYPEGHYVEEWELIENHFIAKVEQLFEPVKDLFIELLINAKYNEILAAFCALSDVCQNIEIDDGDYCTQDCIIDSFSNCSVDLVKFMTNKVESIVGANKSIDNALLQFFNHYFKEHENDPYFEKEIEELIYALLIKSNDTKEFFKLFEIDKFETFPKISSYLIEKNSSVDSWLSFALNSYRLDTAIAEKLLLLLHKTDTKKFIPIALSLLNNPLGYKKEDFYRYEIDDIYHNDQGWNEFLCPLLNYHDHEILFIIVNLNLANKTEKLDYYLKVSKYLDEVQKEKYIKVVWRQDFKVKIFISENKINQAKDIIIQNNSLTNVLRLIQPFRDIEPDFCYQFITEVIDLKLKTERGRDVYATMAELLVFTVNLPNYDVATKEFSLKLVAQNPRLTALKDEFNKAGLI